MTPSKRQMEGNLSKFTNVLKGYQPRFFVIDSDSSTLHYFISENLRHQKPKGSIHLKDTVILASDEDSAMFTIHKFENNTHLVYYLKAQDSIQRDRWIQCLKFNSLPDLDTFDKKEKDSDLDLTNNCLICLETVTQSVATMCGHLFCLKCIHKWIETKPVCPVCNANISKNKLIRLYGITDKTDNLDSTNENSILLNDSNSVGLNESSQRTESTGRTVIRVNEQIIMQNVFSLTIYVVLFSIFGCLLMAVVTNIANVVGILCFIFTAWCFCLLIKRR